MYVRNEAKVIKLERLIKKTTTCAYSPKVRNCHKKFNSHFGFCATHKGLNNNCTKVCL